jgi:hypothetical protein
MTHPRADRSVARGWLGADRRTDGQRRLLIARTSSPFPPLASPRYRRRARATRPAVGRSRRAQLTGEAQTFKDTIERGLDPRMRNPVAHECGDIVGARAYMAGKTAHIAGVTARGNRVAAYTPGQRVVLTRNRHLPRDAPPPAGAHRARRWSPAPTRRCPGQTDDRWWSVTCEGVSAETPSAAARSDQRIRACRAARSDPTPWIVASARMAEPRLPSSSPGRGPQPACGKEAARDPRWGLGRGPRARGGKARAERPCAPDLTPLYRKICRFK